MNQSSTYEVVSWNEDIVLEEKYGRKMVVAHVEQKYSGHIVGISHVEYVMYFLDQSNATFVGIERIEGQVDGKSGIFAVRHVGEFNGGAATSNWTVVESSGAGELAGITGRGTYSALGRSVETQHELLLA